MTKVLLVVVALLCGGICLTAVVETKSSGSSPRSTINNTDEEIVGNNADRKPLGDQSILPPAITARTSLSDEATTSKDTSLLQAREEIERLHTRIVELERQLQNQQSVADEMRTHLPDTPYGAFLRLPESSTFSPDERRKVELFLTEEFPVILRPDEIKFFVRDFEESLIQGEDRRTAFVHHLDGGALRILSDIAGHPDRLAVLKGNFFGKEDFENLFGPHTWDWDGKEPFR